MQRAECFIICNHSHYGGVISKFDNGVGGIDGGPVVCEEGVEEGAEDTRLWCANVQDV